MVVLHFGFFKRNVIAIVDRLAKILVVRPISVIPIAAMGTTRDTMKLSFKRLRLGNAKQFIQVVGDVKIVIGPTDVRNMLVLVLRFSATLRTGIVKVG